MPNLIRWIRGITAAPGELHQLQACREFGFDAMVMYGLYLNTPISSNYVYRPDGGTGTCRESMSISGWKNHQDRTIHIRKV